MLSRIRQIPHNLIFFLLAMLYLWFVIEPRLIYQCFGTILPDAPIFLTGSSFLAKSLSLPGGFIMYVSGLLSQGFYYSWLGAVIVILSALCLCELFRRHLVCAGRARSAVLSCLPAILIFLLYSRYRHPLPACLTVSLGLLFSLFFERSSLRRLAVRAAVYCLMGALLFWLAGAGGLLVFSLMTAIYGLVIRRDFVLSALALPAGFAIVWCLALYVFIIPPHQALLILAPVSSTVTKGMDTFSTVSMVVLYGLVPLITLLLLLTKDLSRKIHLRPKKRSPRSKGKKSSAAARNGALPTILGKVAAATIPIVALGAGLYLTYDPLSKPFVLAHDLSLRKQWDEILELSRTLPKGTSNVYFHHDVIRALYRTGRLPYDMFHFPQTSHGLLLTHEEKVTYLTQLKLCDLFIELGRVNMAEKLASEILASKKHVGSVVEKMAWINIIKGQNRTARVYLNALKKDPIRHGTACTLLGHLDGGFTADEKAYIDKIRSRMYEEGYLGISNESVEQMLTRLLARNPRNKMALEYLMACYLLAGEVDKIAANMGRLGEFNYDGIPTLYEEAVLIYLGSQKQKVDLGRFSIRPETIERYTKFVQIRNSVRPNNRQAVLNFLISEFGNSYFFYRTFGRVGVK